MRRDVTDVPQPEVYYVASHAADAVSMQQVRASDLNLVVRTTNDPRALVPSLRAIVAAAAPNAPLESVMTMRDRVSDSLAQPRLYAILLGTFAAFALIIAGVGLFGVLSYSVALRAREIGVRSALGAQVGDIVAMVVRQAVAIAAAGVAAGLLASIWLGAALRTFLYGVTLTRRGQLRRRRRRAAPRLNPRERRPRPESRVCRSGHCLAQLTRAAQHRPHAPIGQHSPRKPGELPRPAGSQRRARWMAASTRGAMMA